jgi:2'-hydroxyisoflavone reductase
MEINRRRFIQTATAASTGLVVARSAAANDTPPQNAPLRVLILGGTGFIGPHMVRNLLAGGHTVTLFNRGRTNTHLFPEVEKLVGDRNGQLDALEGRTWDAVIDNSGYFVSHVRQSVELLAGAVDHYLFTSTVDAYRDYHEVGIDESYPLGPRPPGAPENPGRYYGPLKAECEAVVQEHFPGKNTRVRPGWIAGPNDNNHLFTYWVIRTKRGGDVLAPGEPDDPMQITDVRDLAEWYVHILENKITGAYNAVGPVITMGGMLEGIKNAVDSDAAFTWVDADFLLGRGIHPWRQIPIWWPPRNNWGERTGGGNIGGVGALALDGSAARAQGLKHHSLEDTALDTLNWYNETFNDWPEDRRPGLGATQEATLLEEWRSSR